MASRVRRATSTFGFGRLWTTPERVLRALARFGAPLGDLRTADLATEGTVFQVGVAPNRVDIITAIDGVTFETAWSRRDVRTIEGLSPSPVIGRDDLIRNKRATGRPRDLADADQLEGNSNAPHSPFVKAYRRAGSPSALAIGCAHKKLATAPAPPRRCPKASRSTTTSSIPETPALGLPEDVQFRRPPPQDNKTLPKYPENALAAHDGPHREVVRFVIDTEGSVDRIADSPMRSAGR